MERPDVSGPMPYMPDGGNWEGGTIDSKGQRWTHLPNRGWQRDDRRRHPYIRESRRERRKRLGLRWWQRESAHHRDEDPVVTAGWELDK